MSLHRWYLRPENNFPGAHSERLFGAHGGSVTRRSHEADRENRFILGRGFPGQFPVTTVRQPR